MINKDALRKYYENILPIMGVTIGDDDCLNTFSIDEEGNKEIIPMMVNNLPVIFPTDAVLREGKWTDRVGFHPLSESTTRGISPVLLSMSVALRFKINQALFFSGVALIKVAKESREGTVKNMPADLVEVLGKLPKTVDAKSLAFFSKIFAASNETDKAIVKICIKRNGSILGTEYKRTTSIYFPIYDQLVEAIENKESEFWGITAARKTDLNLVKEVLEMVLPDLGDPNRYAAGTFASTAPYLDSVTRAAAKVQDSLNSNFELLDKYISSALRSSLQADTTWLEEEVNTRDLRGVIPPLRFNEGDITEEEQRARETDTTRVLPKRSERSSEIPDFNAKGTNAVKRASEQKVSTGAGGRRYIDNSLTDEERTDPERAERRMSSDSDDDYYDRRRDRRDDRDYRDRDRGRGRDYRDRDRDYRDRDRGRSRRDDRDYDRRDRRDDRDYRDRDEDRGGRNDGRTWSQRNQDRKRK